MSKWSDDFVKQYKDTKTVRRLTEEIKKATDKNRNKNKIERTLRDVIKGKYQRRGY